MMYKNFTLQEFVRSNKADELGIDNTPDTECIAHLGELCGTILQPIRDAWGKPIIVTSGYRCKALNKAVGGVSTSAHLSGWAADCVPDDMRQFDHFCDFVAEFLDSQHIPFDQVIIESQNGKRWLHIGVRDLKARQRRMLFKQDL